MTSLSAGARESLLGEAAVAAEPLAVLVRGGAEEAVTAGAPRVAIDDGLLRRVVLEGSSADGHALRITCDRHPTGNLHVYLRLRFAGDVELDAVELPRLRVEGLAALETALGRASLSEPALLPLAEPWLQLRGEGTLGVVVTKLPWAASWNDIGATGYRTLGTRLRVVPGVGVGLRTGPLVARAGETLEAAIVLRALDEPAAALRREAVHDDPREVVYVPREEWELFLSRETEDCFLGPPILGGCQNRPPDQLVPRNLGMDILAHRRFSWNNEDLSLARITGKSLYRDVALKKAYALLGSQNEHGGWWEGYEFYDLPPRHHQHYHSYTAFSFLIDCYDQTGHRPFLEAALRAKDFWFGPPPANSHSEDAPDAWWYRWGGYVNAAGYTDERHALNTHASVLMIMSLLHARTGDEEARRGLDYGVNAFKLALDQGLQRENGQFLYSLSQIDPRLERPGDPPYLREDLIPEIEDVYTVLSAFRLLVANRLARDPAVARACERALNYFWLARRNGHTYTYRSYPVKTYGIAAGELDLRYAFALPALLRDPENWTAIYRGFSGWVAPAGHKGLLVEPEGDPAGIESVFLARDERAFRVALVNVGQPRASLPLSIELDEAASGSRVELLDPGDGRVLSTLPSAERDGRLELELPSVPEESVAVLRLVRPGGA